MHDDHLISVIVAAHTGNLDKQGQSEIWHLMAVASAVPQHLKRIAFCHDALESASLTTGVLLTLGMDADEVAAVDAISRRPGETYRAYIHRLAQNAWAVVVKLADLNINMSRHHLLTSQADKDRLGKRYTAAAWALYELTGMDRYTWVNTFSAEARTVMDTYQSSRKDFVVLVA